MGLRTVNIPNIFVTLEVSQLSGWLNVFWLCRVERARCGPGEAGGGGRQRCTQRAGEWVRLQIGSIRHGGGAHPEHVAHVLYFGGVPAQRLVERAITLQRIERRVNYTSGASRGLGEAGGGGRSARRGVGTTAVWEHASHGEERTTNMWFMSVTLDVSKLRDWLNAGEYCRESKEGHATRDELCGSGGGRRRAKAVHAACRGVCSTAG